VDILAQYLLLLITLCENRKLFENQFSVLGAYMALADILVHLDSSPSSDKRLDLAINLAKEHHARLTGLFVIIRQYYQPQSGAAEAAAEKMRQLFVDRSSGCGIETEWLCSDWSVVGVGMSEIISHHSHYTDLLILGQSSVETEKAGIPAELPERLVLAAGRPVMIVPHSGSFESAGKKVLVAWKAGRESTRAVNDAMPFLKRAKQVQVLAINSSESYGDDGQSLCAGICEHLSRHGITASPEKMMISDSTVGDALLNRACEEGYDLIVMGAYAHSPQGKMILGAVAKQMLKQMTVPIIMSH
jgi:nucleotide-binding universal stress UspA family protein